MNDPTRTPQAIRERLGLDGPWCECTGSRLMLDTYPPQCSLCRRRFAPAASLQDWQPPTPIVDPDGLWAPADATPEDLARRKRIRDAMDRGAKRKPRNNRGRR